MRWAGAGNEGEPLPLFQRFGYVSLFNMLMFGESCKGNDPQVGSAQFMCNTRFFQIRGRVSGARQLTSVMLSKSWTLLMNLTPPVTVILLCCGRMSYSYSIWFYFFKILIFLFQGTAVAIHTLHFIFFLQCSDPRFG